MSVLADIVTTARPYSGQNLDLVYVGRFTLGDVRVSLRMLGLLRAEGDLVLLTRRVGRQDASHEIHRFDELCHDVWSNAPRTEYNDKLSALLRKAALKRTRILSTTTNIFSGVTGRVVKII